MEICCPKCHSDGVQRASVIWMSGSGHFTGVTCKANKIGFVYGDNQTILATTMRPPKKRKTWRIVFCFFLLSLPIIIGCRYHISSVVMGTWNIFFSVMLALCVLGCFVDFAYNRFVFPSVYEQWEHLWHCNCCGYCFYDTMLPPSLQITPSLKVYAGLIAIGIGFCFYIFLSVLVTSTHKTQGFQTTMASYSPRLMNKTSTANVVMEDKTLLIRREKRLAIEKAEKEFTDKVNTWAVAYQEEQAKQFVLWQNKEDAKFKLAASERAAETKAFKIWLSERIEKDVRNFIDRPNVQGILTLSCFSDENFADWKREYERYLRHDIELYQDQCRNKRNEIAQRAAFEARMKQQK